MKGGFPLTKELFIKKMIFTLEKYQKAAAPDDEWQMKIDTMLEYYRISQKKHFAIKHEYPTIDKNLFDAEWIYSTYVNIAFKGSKECFDAWLVDGIEHPDPLNWTLSKRENKPNYAQLRLFINTITNTDTSKDSYYNKVWSAKFKTASVDVSKTFDICLNELRLKQLKINAKKRLIK